MGQFGFLKRCMWNSLLLFHHVLTSQTAESTTMFISWWRNQKNTFFLFFFFQLFVIITGSFLELCIHWKLILSSTLYIPTRCVLAGTESICCSFPIHKLDAIYFLVACYFFLELYHFLQGKANLLCFWNCKQIMLNLF